MESTGKREKIQCSQSTADVLTEAGKGHWVKPREEKVHAKGKGELQTYFVEPISSGKSSVHTSLTSLSEMEDKLMERLSRCSSNTK